MSPDSHQNHRRDQNPAKWSVSCARKHRRRLWFGGLAIAGVALFFVGCLELRESRYWKPAPVREKTALKTTVDRQIRVRLCKRGKSESRKLAVESPFKITDAGSARLLKDHRGNLPASIVKLTHNGDIKIGHKIYPSNDILVSPDRDASIVLGERTYRGMLRLHVIDGKLVFTNNIDIEAYLRGVLRGELPGSFHAESFKAQCVAARTYVLYQKQKNGQGRSFDVYDNEGSQMYLGVAGEDRKAVKAVDATSGEVCVCDQPGGEAIFCTYYCSACGGATQSITDFKPRDPAVAPLAGGVICRDCYLAKFYRWAPVKLSKAEVTKRIVSHYPSVKRLGLITRLRTKARTPEGRIGRLELIGQNGTNETLVGEDFRLTIGGRILKSTSFEINDLGDAFVFTEGKGYGHGVGLCQNGMETKARRGWDYNRILSAYYPGASIKRIY